MTAESTDWNLSGTPRIYPEVFRLVFQNMEPERAHGIGFQAIRSAESTGLSLAYRKLATADPALRTRVMGLEFPSPFGLAAGFDKAGRGTAALMDLGFGHVEVGTITAQPQPGNPAPRMHRLPQDQALINRMGFNNAGARVIEPRLAATRKKLTRRFGIHRPILGVNIGKTKVVALDNAVEDYRESTDRLARHADYLVVNVSSPNTPGLRQLQAVEALRPILTAVRDQALKSTGRHVPLAVKIAPDLADEDVLAVADLAGELGLDGLVATNTTISRKGLVTDPTTVESYGGGGLSGKPLSQRSLDVLILLRAHLDATGSSLAVMSVGGVTTGADVIQRLRAGADLVQGYTAFLYQGPLWVYRINRDLRNNLSAWRHERVSGGIPHA
ncbi:quinone-dependent dihydroorotate dehydrogenase [Auritidibacter ignavus]|uniref:quinone-dependent dihydroorotate dehydrogenase n=1 Tax=Auritidibacter ignavus TaxID=678932 RepID=UPI0024BA9AD5|nr:quinone-dependent dihydroorotate dehydrogenase [Auritidibacter ignavus]WHS27879.1 quinone-dependent dihydroorotate dehydrogenase [Auritidibacter ignavus]